MVKDEVLRIITSMDDNVSLEDIMYQLYILEKHNKAILDIKDGRLYTTQDVVNSLNMS